MTDINEHRIGLGRAQMVGQWLLAAIEDDNDRLGELQELTKQTCPCCVATITRGLAEMAAHFAQNIELLGQTGARRMVEAMLLETLDVIAELDEEDGP
jgi:hypothetical protein